MVWTCRAQHRLDYRSMQAECCCTEKIWQAKEIMGWSAWEWQKEARYGFCWPSKSFWVERTPSRKTCQKAQPSVEENRALKWIWWWWWFYMYIGVEFNIQLTTRSWRRDLGLKSHPKDWRSGGSNQWPQDCRTNTLTTASCPLLYIGFWAIFSPIFQPIWLYFAHIAQ